METQEGPASEVNHAERLRRRLTEGMVVALDEAVPDHVVDAVAYGMGTVQVTRDQLQAHISPQQAYGVDSGQAIARMQRNINQWASDEIAAQTQGPVTTRQELDAFVNASQPIPATPPPVPITKEALLAFFEVFHNRPPSPEDLAVIDTISLDDRNIAKEAVANYVPQVIENEEDTIDLPDTGNLTQAQRDIMNDVNHHEAMLTDARSRLRLEFETDKVPSISKARIIEDFSDFWDAHITGNMELELTSKYDCKLSHTFKEKPGGPDRTINVNLGKYKFIFRLTDLAFLKCIPQNFRVMGSITAAHPHVKGHICWGTQNEVANDAIIRKDFKKFSTLLFQAINNYNHSSTFCGLLRYKIHVRDFDGENFVFKAGNNYRHMELSRLPAGINLSSVYSTDGVFAQVLTYRRYMPYLNDYLPGNYFKVSKSISQVGFIPDERDPERDYPTYQVVSQAEIDRIIEKRGDNEVEMDASEEDGE